MLFVIEGNEEIVRQIWVYILILIFMMLLLVYLLYVSGVIYVVLVIYFGVIFIKKVWQLLKDFSNKDVV